MLNISKFFKNDIVTPNQTLKPVVVITDPANDNVLFTLTEGNNELYDNNGNLIKSINCINKVSNVRLSTDYDSKKLKINRLRCTLYNYYDINTKITEYINNSIISKNLYLFYKSPTTNVITFTNEINDYDCALIYRGEISRLDFNNETLNVTAEDRTQIKISNKKVPFMSADKLPTDVKNNILSAYNEEDVCVPMTFGKVDKASTLAYYDANNDTYMNLLVDFFPTNSHYKTSKIPSLLSKGNIRKDDYFLYVKEGNDYVILDHIDYTFNLQNQIYSKFILSNTFGQSYVYIASELRPEDDAMFNLWDMRGYNLRQVVSGVASAGSVTELHNSTIDNLQNEDFINENKLSDNNQLPRIWYREDDIINGTGSYFDTGLESYNTTTQGGQGRWIILKLEEGVSMPLLNIKIDSQWAGNTFFLCDWKVKQYAEGSIATPNMSSTGNNDTGFFVVPLSTEIWGKIIPEAVQNGFLTNTQGLQALANIINCTDDNQLDIAKELDVASLQNLNTPTSNFYEDACIELPYQYSARYENFYWGDRAATPSSTNIFRKLNGLYYGETGSATNIIGQSADSHSSILVYEYFPPNWNGSYSYSQRLEINNAGLAHSVKVDNVSARKIYASIIGRQSNLYTEQVDESLLQQESEVEEDLTAQDIPLEALILGPDGQLPNFDHLVQRFESVVYNTLNESVPLGELDPDYDGIGPAQYWADFTPEDLDRIANTEDWDYLLNQNWSNSFAGQDDSPFCNNYAFFKEYMFKPFLYNFKIAAALDLLVYCIDAQYVQADEDDQSGFLEICRNELPKYTGPIRKFFDVGWVRTYAINIFRYLYQTDIPYGSISNSASYLGYVAPKFTNIFYNNSNGWYIGGRQIAFGGDADGFGAGPIDDDNTFDTNRRDFAWNTLPNEINTVEDLRDNLYLYIDDWWSTALHYTWSLSYSEFNVSGFPLPTIEAGFTQMPVFDGPSHSDPNGNNLEIIWNQLLTQAAYYAFEEEQQQEEEENLFSTDGIISKPSDIVMNILTSEMEYGKYDSEQTIGSNVIVPDYNQYDIDSIELSRQIHSNWKMGFCINKKKDGKKLIEEILLESKSYPRFNSSGKFGFINIKDSYTYEDISKTININEILNYKFSETKREDILTKCKMFYRFDNGTNKYSMSLEKNISDYIENYPSTGYEYYNIDEIDAYEDLKLRYHTDTATVEDFMRYTLLNRCNTHNIVEMSLPLNYMDLSVSDIIHIPLINNEKIFDIDYSVVDYKNTQPVYPLWLILETNIGTNQVKIKAYQLHYLGTDGNHGFTFPQTTRNSQANQRTGNMQQFNSKYRFTTGEPIPNYNYDPTATIDSGFEIPYFDIGLDGDIGADDYNRVVDVLINGNGSFTQQELELLKYNSDGSINTSINNADTVSEIDDIITN
tara:strand:+ start:147 stop:4343 length:4197 start_codon:yes stop_codon:yes gene_type:complete